MSIMVEMGIRLDSTVRYSDVERVSMPELNQAPKWKPTTKAARAMLAEVEPRSMEEEDNG